MIRADVLRHVRSGIVDDIGGVAWGLSHVGRLGQVGRNALDAVVCASEIRASGFCMSRLQTFSWLAIFLSLTAAGSLRAEEIKVKAQPFDLSEVRLLDSPFKAAQDADAKYMASLDLDRLLHNFRINAGLPTTASPLGGWEAPSCEVRGHFVGHYLTACALMYKSTGDPEWKRRADYLVVELGKCQDALGTGYLSAFPASAFDKLEAGIHVWAPYYTIHKIMAGLFDAYQLCGNAQALDIDKKMATYFADRISKLNDDQIERTFHTTGVGPGTEFGGMSIVLHQLYGITGDFHDLELANTFDRDWLAVPLAHGEDPLADLHANTHIPQVDGFAWHYRVTGDTKYRDAAENFWQLVTDHHSFVTGSNSFAEHFAKPGIEASRLSPNTAETCNTYNMLKLTRDLFQLDPKPQYADYYERALYNHILGSIDPTTGMTTYFLSLAPVISKCIARPPIPSGAAPAPASRITPNMATASISTTTIHSGSICSFPRN